MRWHHFDAVTFDVGRDTITVGPERAIGLYSAERGIIDAYRLRHRETPDMATEALKRWLKAGGQPSTLLTMAKSFPRTLRILRTTLAVLL